jgi:hypothetical protein
VAATLTDMAHDIDHDLVTDAAAPLASTRAEHVMMRKHRAVVAVVAGLALAGCSKSSPTPTAAPPTTVTATDSTDTTAAATDTTAAQAMTASDVVAKLKTAGLPIAETKDYTADDDPNKLLGRPNQYTSKTSFHDSTLPKSASFSTDGGGSVEVFDTADLAKAREDYVKSVIGTSALLAEYDYLSGPVLLRLGHELTPTQAKAYQDALNS